MDDLPADVRARIESARADGEATVHHVQDRRYTFTDSKTGRTHTYRSLDEMPEHLRRLIEEFEGR